MRSKISISIQSHRRNIMNPFFVRPSFEKKARLIDNRQTTYLDEMSQGPQELPIVQQDEGYFNEPKWRSPCSVGLEKEC